MNNILICDDEQDIVSALRIYLESEGMNVTSASNGREAVEIMRSPAGETMQLILLDVMMPEMDGIAAMAEIRKESNVPIIMLTAKSEDADKVIGLTVGADDYVTKPFNPVELMARVKSQLRRYTMLGAQNGKMNIVNTDIITIGGIELNDKSKEVTLDGNPVSLTPLEYDILKLLMTHKGEVLSPRDIYENVWKETVIGAESTVAVHIRHLREKLEYDSANPRYLKAVWGHGYKMDS
ncbi:DNA-binding response regulator, OmpR family, contains REC and winged-helix (wHTH) domain [Pseudobutyrivibrio sp. UC1225]|uniref:response regulator transcription factor n=1 Tax=Pseudobutyrivibrio sp. UC1225 TaxID=1798185 RepID=UPI0008E1254E|nr:response regulator transcription factor [Pseudobutyrivibrio sp. UC1225]SFO32430.1 DNA-binding response regulator, OmpR family, contains REC and winged-helix (wHTH) domain [Pseudobutyrivibrio sp. UC1225]